MLAMAAALDHRTSALQLTNAPARSLLSVQRPLITVPLLALLPLVLAIFATWAAECVNFSRAGASSPVQLARRRPRKRRALQAQISTLLEAHPLPQVLTSMPGVGVRTAAVLLTTVGDGSRFPAVHLASYAGLAPTTRSSGTSIHGEQAFRGGNRQPKRGMFLSASACMSADPCLPHLLRQTARPRKPPRPPAHQRPVRHARRRNLLRVSKPRHLPRHLNGTDTTQKLTAWD